MRRKNAGHWPGENSSTAPDGLRESRTSTDCPWHAISTQFPWSALKLLLRQVGPDCWLGRADINHPSVRRAAYVVRRPGDEGGRSGQELTGQRRPLLSTFPDWSVDDPLLPAYGGARPNVSLMCAARSSADAGGAQLAYVNPAGSESSPMWDQDISSATCRMSSTESAAESALSSSTSKSSAYCPMRGSLPVMSDISRPESR